MIKIRPSQIADDGATPGQLMGRVGDTWGPVDPPSSPDDVGSGPFFDDFERTDTPLEGNNGWVSPTGHTTETATFYIEGGVVKQTGSGAFPILHDRGSPSTDVADVTMTTAYGPSGGVGFGFWGLCVCSDAAGDNGLMLVFDGSAFQPGVNRFAPDGQYSGTMAWTDTGWAGWGLTETMVLRCVYTESTSTMDVYQNDVLVLTGDVSDTGGGFFIGSELTALSTMPMAGFMSDNADHSHTFDLFSIDGATEPPSPSGVVLDDLLDVDTTTTAPADQQFLKFDVASGLWVPADLPSSTTGAPFDVTDTPEDPPPYAGYAYMTSDGKVRIWSGTEWRELTTVLYEPPGAGDPDIDLASLIGRYKAADLAYADGVAVAAWPDSSAAGNDLVTVTAGTMETTGIGGLASVVFDTFTAYNLPAATGRPCTIVVVMQNTDSGEGSIVFSSPGGVAPYLGMLNGVGWRASDGSNVLDVALSTTLDPHVYYTQFDAGVVNGGYDGGLSTTSSVNIVTIQRIGRYESAPSYSMTGLVSEILVYDVVLTSGELDAIAVSLGTTYGIIVTP